MSRIIRSLSSDIVIPFHAWEPRNSSHNGRKSKGITAESLQGGPAVSPHNLLRPLPPSRGEAASSKRIQFQVATGGEIEALAMPEADSETSLARMRSGMVQLPDLRG